MNSGKTIFAQLMNFLPAYEFRKCVDQYNGNYKMISFSCWDQYLCMAFAQLTYRESLRDIQVCLRATQSRLYHLGIRGKVSRNTLAHANQTRDWRIYADFAHILITKARKLYAADSFGIELDQAVYALDSTTIDLCLALFPWAEFRKRKGAVKLHTLLDLHGNIPSVVIITTGKIHDVNILDELIIEVGAIYDHGSWLSRFCTPLQNQSDTGILCHSGKNQLQPQTPLLYACRQINRYPMRSDCYPQRPLCEKGLSGKNSPYPLLDSKNNKTFVFLTNNFTLPAITIADLYRCRWQVELFFKWIKQHLRIKAFYGTTENAVKTQIWIAISVYVLVAIVKKTLGLNQSLYTILQILSVTLFEKTPMFQALSSINYTNQECYISNQLNLFD